MKRTVHMCLYNESRPSRPPTSGMEIQREKEADQMQAGDWNDEASSAWRHGIIFIAECRGQILWPRVCQVS